jgi:DDE superfamily endonuclease
MAMLILTDDEVLTRGLHLVGFGDRQARANKETNLERFTAHFGSKPQVCAQIWEDLQTTNIEAARVSGNAKALDKAFDYFMAALHFLTTYPTEKQRSGIFKRCERTSRDWGWTSIQKLSALKEAKIGWPQDWVPENPNLPYFLLSVDGTHCSYHEVKHPDLPYDPQMYSHKTNGPGLSYEVALAIHDCKVVSVRGPFKASVHDKTIFVSHLRDLIPDGCVGIADRGYRGVHNLSTPNSYDTNAVKRFKKRARARQESFFHRLKRFAAVRNQFRHRDMEKHRWTFEAACVIVQYQFENGSPLFSP